MVVVRREEARVGLQRGEDALEVGQSGGAERRGEVLLLRSDQGVDSSGEQRALRGEVERSGPAIGAAVSALDQPPAFQHVDAPLDLHGIGPERSRESS
jgi:hypothetical protein